MSPDRRALTREEVREVDRRAIEEYGLPGLVLMENAGRGAAELLIRRSEPGRAVICCGKGNNGGDGFVIARRLEVAGWRVEVLLAADPKEITGDAAVNYQVALRGGIPIERCPEDRQELAERFRGADWIVDALLGTGTSGGIREPYASIIDAINSSGRKVLAVDLPSGLDCDTGKTLGPCVRADLTATFVARKVGFAVPSAKPFLGEVHVIDIGVPRRLLERLRLI